MCLVVTCPWYDEEALEGRGQSASARPAHRPALCGISHLSLLLTSGLIPLCSESSVKRVKVCFTSQNTVRRGERSV